MVEPEDVDDLQHGLEPERPESPLESFADIERELRQIPLRGPEDSERASMDARFERLLASAQVGHIPVPRWRRLPVQFAAVLLGIASVGAAAAAGAGYSPIEQAADGVRTVIDAAASMADRISGAPPSVRPIEDASITGRPTPAPASGAPVPTATSGVAASGSPTPSPTAPAPIATGSPPPDPTPAAANVPVTKPGTGGSIATVPPTAVPSVYPAPTLVPPSPSPTARSTAQGGTPTPSSSPTATPTSRTPVGTVTPTPSASTPTPSGTTTVTPTPEPDDPQATPTPSSFTATYGAGAAGSVKLLVGQDWLVVSAVEPADGWTATTDKGSGKDVAVRFQRGEDVVQFWAGADGFTVTVHIEEDIKESTE